jgi:molybdate transport system ATP-binding protein
MVVMDQGAVIAQGPPRDLLARADLPILADRAEPGSLIEARVTGRSADGGALCVVNGAQLSAPVSGEIGDIVRLYVFARDVILALAPPQGLSVRNILPCRITALDSREDGGVLVTLEAGETRLLSAITQEAVTDLQLRPGLELYALIKAAALKGGARGLLDALN